MDPARSVPTRPPAPRNTRIIISQTGAIFTFAFDDEKLTLELVKRTEIPKDEPISWMSFNVSCSPLASGAA
jgi:hypothetical protein